MSNFKDSTGQPEPNTLTKFLYILLFNHLTVSELDEILQEIESMPDYELNKNRVAEKLMSIARIYAKQLRK